MLQLLPWNAYDKTPVPMSTLQMFLPPTPVSAARPVKRKRSDNDGNRSDATPFASSAPLPVTPSNHLPNSLVSAHAAALPPLVTPSTQVNFARPSDGLPTPILSPTMTIMEDKGKESVSSEPSSANRHRNEARRNKTRQVIAQQINLEILVKHNELRLIDQELAKCQVALEQLRRCTEIPYPVTQLSEHVANGTGPALKRLNSRTKPPASPAPWGVADGPYTRHYSQWLLPASQFDTGEPEILVSSVTGGKRPVIGRKGRSVPSEDLSGPMSSRSQRNNGLQALPAGYGHPKEKASGPLVIKRKSDGKMVMLRCPDCARQDFGSAQGFINHCRIGHQRTFASHDAAAEACGEDVEYNKDGEIMGVEPVTTPLATNVHPLIRSAHMLPAGPAPTAKVSVGDLDRASSTSATTVESPDFRGSVSTPFLSALIQGKGLGLNLHDAVTEAKVKVEFSEHEDEMDIEEDVTIPEDAIHGHPLVGGTRGIAAPAKSTAQSPLLQSRFPVKHEETSEADNRVADFGHPIEPSPTTESNQAPSLIDDDEVYEADSPASTPSEAAEDSDVHVRVQDDDEVHQVESSTDFQASCAQPLAEATPSPAIRPSALRKDSDMHEEKHVSFRNASPAAEQVNADRSKKRKVVK